MTENAHNYQYSEKFTQTAQRKYLQARRTTMSSRTYDRLPTRVTLTFIFFKLNKSVCFLFQEWYFYVKRSKNRKKRTYTESILDKLDLEWLRMEINWKWTIKYSHRHQLRLKTLTKESKEERRRKEKHDNLLRIITTQKNIYVQVYFELNDWYLNIIDACYHIVYHMSISLTMAILFKLTWMK